MAQALLSQICNCITFSAGIHILGDVILDPLSNGPLNMVSMDGTHRPGMICPRFLKLMGLMIPVLMLRDNSLRDIFILVNFFAFPFVFA
jgi:hypothetical protein